MKKLIIISCMLIVANFGFSQKNTTLQGPAAKNAKPWHKKSKKTKIVYIKNKEFLKGPVAKNVKPWQKGSSNQAYTKVESTNRYELKGPKAKNFKPWISSTPVAIETIVINDRDSSDSPIFY